MLRPRLRPLSRLLPVLLGLVPLTVLAANAPPARQPMSVQDMIRMDRISEPALSPDGGLVVFTVASLDAAGVKRSNALWIGSTKAGAPAPHRLLAEGVSGSTAAFSPDGKAVYFIASKSGSDQLWRVPVAGGTPEQVTSYPLDIGAYKLSPDGKALALSFAVFTDCKDLACTQTRMKANEERKATGVIFDKIFIRHWDTWVDGTRNQLFTAAIGADGKAAAEPTLVSRGIDGDIPSKPFGDTNEFAWSPDGKSLAFDVRIAGRSEPWSTNFDIYLVPADGSAAPRNLTAKNLAWDAGPVFSADGKTLYYRAMKVPGFEADRFGLMAMDLATGATREIDPQWDRSADGITLSADGKTIYTGTDDLGRHPLFAVDIASGKAKKIVADGSVSAVALGGNTLMFARNSMKYPDQVYVARLDGSGQRQISHNDDAILGRVAMADYEQFSFPGWNDEKVYGFVLKPWNWQPGQKYPVVFLIHGGPQGSFGDDWSYRWNPEWYASQGYAAVMVDFHGSVGYGQAFTDAISQHWGDRPLEDLKKGWAAALQKYSYLDGNNACALGASYGGYMIYWLAGNWIERDGSKPFKCLVDHDGVFDNRMMGYATEELWFSEHENGGTVWENPAGYERFNPIDYVKDWTTPMLVVHSQHDYRIPVEQGIGAFTALQRKGVESKYLYFPDESHWVLKPQNSVLWHDTVAAWLKEHLQAGQ
ncbi:MAG: S9 family peptidase [Proteobacteria bacterium]|nr:S9 family peptidase [Pseudomonadota bacterium]